MQSYELPRSSNQLEQPSCQVASPDLARVQMSSLGQSLSHYSSRLHPSFIQATIPLLHQLQ